jgi:CRISPR-associated protein Cas5h
MAMDAMDTIRFAWSAKYGHFLRAEATVNALSYPLPPRTAVLGLLGAILGLEKDALAVELAELRVAVSGPMPRRFWHRVKLRKDPPSALSWEVRRKQRGAERPAPEKAALLNQEWLLAPRYQVHLAWPEQPARFEALAARIRDRRWHFTPCMGLSELLCEVEWLARGATIPLPPGQHYVQGVCPADETRLLAEDGLGVHLLRMPRQVSAQRVFQHAPYYIEHSGRPFAVETSSAWQLGDWTGVFL